ncbi:hypothetical protein ACJJTC_006648 [Scirpophaga incertulas]
MGNVQCCASGRFHEGKPPKKPKNNKKKLKGINKKSNGVGGKGDGGVKVVIVAEEGSERAAPAVAQAQAQTAPAVDVATPPRNEAPAPSELPPCYTEIENAVDNGTRGETMAAARERFFNQIDYVIGGRKLSKKPDDLIIKNPGTSLTTLSLNMKSKIDATAHCHSNVTKPGIQIDSDGLVLVNIVKYIVFARPGIETKLFVESTRKLSHEFQEHVAKNAAMAQSWQFPSIQQLQFGLFALLYLFAMDNNDNKVSEDNVTVVEHQKGKRNVLISGYTYSLRKIISIDLVTGDAMDKNDCDNRVIEDNVTVVEHRKGKRNI